MRRICRGGWHFEDGDDGDGVDGFVQKEKEIRSDGAGGINPHTADGGGKMCDCEMLLRLS